MPASQVVFTGVPAFVGSVLSETRVKFFLEENQFDLTKTIEVDLAKNPFEVPPAQWATGVDVDYQTTGGLTTIGPKFNKGPHVGAVYLAQRLVTQYAQLLADAHWPPQGDQSYQYQAIVRSDNGNVSRFHGFRVRVLTPASGSQAHLAFIRPGAAGPAGGRAAARWIDLADLDVCDPASNGFTTITQASPVGTEGALFLNRQVTAADSPTNPKIPKSLGW